MQGYASREAVLDILLEQEETGAFLKDLFIRHAEALPAADRALAREMALGVMRNRTLLDYNIDLCAARKPGPGILRTLLRLTAYQILFMDVPDFAAVNVGVELAKRRGGKEKAGFANAVLKKVASQGLRRAPGNTLKALSTNFSHPLWLVERWHRRLGPKALLQVLERNNQEAPVWIRVNPAKTGVAEARAALEAAGAACEPDAHAGPYLKLAEGSAGKALHSDLFARGGIAFQDPAAYLVAELAAWRPGSALLDLCSAPGGKAAAILERAILAGEAVSEAGLRAVCNDISFRRLRRIRDARERLGHGGMLPLAMDPGHAALKRRFDLIVVDAPCSNLGVIRRRPEARWTHAPGDLARMAAIQSALLRQAAALAAPGGCVVYATCSPEPEESLAVVEAFLKADGRWSLHDAASALPAWAVKSGCLWLHPGESEYDGFFAARLIRKEAA